MATASNHKHNQERYSLSVCAMWVWRKTTVPEAWGMLFLWVGVNYSIPENRTRTIVEGPNISFLLCLTDLSRYKEKQCILNQEFLSRARNTVGWSSTSKSATSSSQLSWALPGSSAKSHFSKCYSHCFQEHWQDQNNATKHHSVSPHKVTCLYSTEDEHAVVCVHNWWGNKRQQILIKRKNRNKRSSPAEQGNFSASFPKVYFWFHSSFTVGIVKIDLSRAGKLKTIPPNPRLQRKRRNCNANTDILHYAGYLWTRKTGSLTWTKEEHDLPNQHFPNSALVKCTKWVVLLRKPQWLQRAQHFSAPRLLCLKIRKAAKRSSGQQRPYKRSDWKAIKPAYH